MAARRFPRYGNEGKPGADGLYVHTRGIIHAGLAGVKFLTSHVEDTAKLMEVSQNAQERAARTDEGYARITVEKAAPAVARNYGKGRA